ncbi:MAG: hypothetical protein ACUVTR_03460 [Dehalococcoidia bacterium]
MKTMAKDLKKAGAYTGVHGMGSILEVAEKRHGGRNPTVRKGGLTTNG